MKTLRTETRDGVRSVVLCRPEAYNTITPELRDELSAAIDAADADPGVRVILLRAEGPAFCAGYGLDWSTAAQAQEQEQAAEAAAGERGRVWDSVADMRMMGRFVDTYMKLWYAKKPTIAAVQGWCIGGGTDMVLCADLIIAGQTATFGYPPSRVWGTPTTAMWVYRMGLEKAKRYLLTGDEIPAAEAARIGLILECVPDDGVFHSYGDVEDAFFERYPTEAGRLQSLYGHRWRDGQKSKNQYSMSAYLSLRLRDLQKEQVLDVTWLPAEGPWAYNGIISHWRVRS